MTGLITIQKPRVFSTGFCRIGLVFVVFLLFLSDVAGFPTPRRRYFEERKENVYLLVPAVASMPGIGVFVGGLGSISNINGTGIDGAATVAESIDNTDISVKAIALKEVPLLIPGLTLDYQYADIKLGNFQTFLPGRNSPNFTVPFTGEFDIRILFLNWRLFDRRFNLSYYLGFFDGFSVDETGEEIQQASHTAGGNLLLDFTDDVIDPRIGFRIRYNTSLKPPKESILGKDSEQVNIIGGDEDLTVESYQFTYYSPYSDRSTLVWDNRYFSAKGLEDSGEVIAGGGPPLRGYPGSRWRDRFGVYMALEYRYTVPMNTQIDFLLARGVLEGIQLALFYEVGQVNPDRSKRLYEEVHTTTGVGIRALLEAIVLRLDIANSDEGPQVHLTIGQPFY